MRVEFRAEVVVAALAALVSSILLLPVTMHSPLAAVLALFISKVLWRSEHVVSTRRVALPGAEKLSPRAPPPGRFT